MPNLRRDVVRCPIVCHEDVLLDVQDRVCSCCGGALHLIGESVSETLDWVLPSFALCVQPVLNYACRACNIVVQAGAPERSIAGGLATPPLLVTRRSRCSLAAADEPRQDGSVCTRASNGPGAAPTLRRQSTCSLRIARTDVQRPDAHRSAGSTVRTQLRPPLLYHSRSLHVSVAAPSDSSLAI
ncbi:MULTISPECIES: IS66 family transposase zinc-finger binding domain-containing protein [unclassified Bradyrhizobium]|uniref:IS66 family transposase zinc-finger binding domain-containing protein n=1 Tax=unclassified Bradyrhizobium TaxID=2631580 RepID=UPI0028ED08AE|nr:MULTISPECIES: IS66 family transposase zinc-finger binding domain-containing protein [unclassified Bradyrhizobium]